MGKVNERDMQLTGQLPVIGIVLLVFLAVLLVADSISESKIGQAGLRTVIVEARDCKTNVFQFEYAGELSCELIVVDHDKREVYGFIHREFVNTDDEVKKLDSLPDIVNGHKFEVTYDPNNVAEFTAKPVGYETVFDMIE